MCYNDWVYFSNIVFFVVDVFCFVIGWYVIYYNERFFVIVYFDDYFMYVFNDVCEVEVFGMCNLMENCFLDICSNDSL